MKTNILFRQNLQSVARISIAGFFLGLLYPLFGSEHTDTVAFINGVSIGITGGALLSLTEIYLFPIESRRWSFIVQLFLKTAFYFVLFTVLILSIMCLTRSIENNQGYIEYFFGEQFQYFIWQGHFRVILIYCLIMLSIINFTRQIDRKIGQGLLFNYVLGKYHKPKEEERVFAFIDLKKSTQIAESLGALRFHKLLHEFFYDVSMPILATNGKIYRYVGDEIVVSWKVKKGLEEANSIRSYFLMKKAIRDQSSKYLRLFGIVPDFHAAFHVGMVIRGEIGDIKSQLVFHGETMFITSKIEAECGPANQDLLISDKLLQKLNLPSDYRSIHVGTLPAYDQIELHTVEAADIAIA